jgi:multidrug efflux system outer membrane protein
VVKIFTHTGFAMIILSGTLGGCASRLSMPSSTSLLPPIAVADKWSSTDLSTSGNSSIPIRKVALSQWWTVFNDVQLNQLIVRALSKNTDIAIAKATLQQSRAARDLVEANLYPRLDGKISAQRNKNGDSTTNNFAVSVDAAWEPDIFGSNRNALRASDASVSAYTANLADIQVSVAAEVALVYLQLRGAQARSKIAKANLDSQLETLQLTEWRVKAGLLTALEQAQAITASEQTKAQIPVLDTSITQLTHSLAVLIGEAPHQLKKQFLESRPVPMADASLSFSFPAETLRQRPDIRAAEFQVESAWARVMQADAALYPRFQLSGSLGLRALSISGLSNGASLIAGILANASLPIYDAGVGKAQVQMQRAAFEQARMAYQSIVLNALKEVEDALVALYSDRQRHLNLFNATQSAVQAAQLAKQRFTSGLVDYQVVLETQRTLLNTQDALTVTEANLSTDHVRLYKALGGGWKPDVDEVNPLVIGSLPMPLLNSQ